MKSINILLLAVAISIFWLQWFHSVLVQDRLIIRHLTQLSGSPTATATATATATSASQSGPTSSISTSSTSSKSATTSSSATSNTSKKKVIVFALFAMNKDHNVPGEMFTSGLIHNLYLQKQVYPDWKVRVYLAQNLDAQYIKLLEECGAEVKLCPFETSSWMDGMFWRFYPADDEEVERFIVRDIDSRLNLREKYVVDEWIETGTPFHVVKDNPLHSIPVMGGMWGGIGGMLKYAQPKPIKTMKQMCDEYSGKASKGEDQNFLGTTIWPLMQHNVTVHASNNPNCVRKTSDIKSWEQVGTKCFTFVTDDQKLDFNGYYYVGSAYGDDRIDQTLDCTKPPTCTHVCRYYKDEYKELTGRDFPYSFYNSPRPDKLRCP